MLQIGMTIPHPDGNATLVGGHVRLRLQGTDEDGRPLDVLVQEELATVLALVREEGE